MSKTVDLPGVTTASMVLATAQQAKTVFVKSAVPGNGSFTIRLTGEAPAGGLKVVYFVINEEKPATRCGMDPPSI